MDIESARTEINSLTRQLNNEIEGAKVDAFRQAYKTRSGDYPSRSEIADFLAGFDDAATWVNAHVKSPNELSLQSQIDSLRRALARYEGQPLPKSDPATPVFIDQNPSMPASFWQTLMQKLTNVLKGGQK